MPRTALNLIAVIAAVGLCMRPVAGAEPQLLHVSMQSTRLSTFFGEPVDIGATILLPDSYYRDPGRRYPVVYWIPGFDGSDNPAVSTELAWQNPMRSLKTEFIVVFLQAMAKIDGEDVHTEFADSAHDGPWGSALVRDFIPATDDDFRTIATGKARFLFGHSSGGWSALWLQINYPDVFNGAWALSPDPVDFHYFLGPDITEPDQNFYYDASGHAYGFCRFRGHDLSTLRRFVLSPLGCNLRPRALVAGTKPWPERQMDTYDDVFGPPDPDRRVRPLFDRRSGLIDPAVAAYWEEHYDITHVLQERWRALSPVLSGKLHVFVGSEDTFHLESSVRLMQDALRKLGSDAEFGIAPGADHWQIYGYHGGMIEFAMREMGRRLQP